VKPDHQVLQVNLDQLEAQAKRVHPDQRVKPVQQDQPDKLAHLDQPDKPVIVVQPGLPDARELAAQLV